MVRTCTIAALIIAAAVNAAAQGTIDFRNRITGTLDVPIVGPTGVRLGDPNFVAQLYFSATQGGSYAAVTAAPAPFRTGAGAGYWNAGADSTRILTGIAGGSTAWLQVRVWNSLFGGTYEEAVAAGSLYGTSPPFSVTAGGGGVPPSPPAVMMGLMWIPEPSAIVLGALGLLGLGLSRRRR